MIYILENIPSNPEAHIKQSKIGLLENINPPEMDDGGRKILYLDSYKSELIFSSPNNLDILEKIKLYLSCNLLFDSDSKLDCKNIIEIKINDVLYCFSKLNLNDFLYENKNISSLILENFKINSNLQVKNFFAFLENVNDSLQYLEINNLSLEILDFENQQLFYYIKIKNNQIILVNKEIGQEKVINIKNLILNNSPLCIIEGDENFIDNDINISINKMSLLAFNYCGIIEYKYNKNDNFINIHFDYSCLEKNSSNEMEIDNEDENNKKKKLNKIENFKNLISNKNFKCNCLKLSNFKEPIEIEIGCPNLIKELYFDNCLSDLTQNIIDKCPNLTKLKLKGINDKNNIKIPPSIMNLNIRDSYIEISSLPNLITLTISLYYLEENKELYEQREQYNKTIDSLKKILNDNNIKNITLKGNEILTKLELNNSCISNSIIIYGNCEIKSDLFQKFNKENEIEFHNCTLEKTEKINWTISFKKITFDFNTFNEIIFQVISKNDINDIDDLIKNISLNEDKTLKEKFDAVQKRMMDVFKDNNFKIRVKSFDFYRKVVLSFFIFKNDLFKTYDELLNNYQKHLEQNYYIFKSKKINEQSIIKIPILMSDYLTNEQIEFMKNLKDIEIVLN